MNQIKTFDNFVASVKDALAKEFPGCQVGIIPVTKNNGVRLQGISVRPKGTSIAPNIYMEKYFSDFQDGRLFADIIKELKSVYRQGMDNAAIGINTDAIQDFSFAKDKICYKLVNRELNAGFLSTAPHRDFHGLAVAYYINLSTAGGEMASVTVMGRLADIWGVEEEELYGFASVNTPKLNHGQVIPLSGGLDILAGKHSPQDMEYGCCQYDGFDFTCVDKNSLPLYIATNTSKIHGAAVILYKGLLEAVAKRNGSFFVLPSSVHECIFAPGVPEDAERMAEMVRIINTTQVAAEEVLYNGCFYYNAENHELHKAA